MEPNFKNFDSTTKSERNLSGSNDERWRLMAGNAGGVIKQAPNGIKCSVLTVKPITLYHPLLTIMKWEFSKTDAFG